MPWYKFVDTFFSYQNFIIGSLKISVSKNFPIKNKLFSIVQKYRIYELRSKTTADLLSIFTNSYFSNNPEKFSRYQKVLLLSKSRIHRNYIFYIIETTNSKIISYIRYILLPTYFTKKKKSSPPWSNPQSNKSRSHNTNKNSRINFHTSNKSLSTKCLNTTLNIWLWRNLLITKKKKEKKENPFIRFSQ